MATKLYYYRDSQAKSDATEVSSPHSFTVSSNTTIKAFATKDGCLESDVTSRAITSFKVTTPQLTASYGTVTITCATDGATIYYTTDGSTPTTASEAYSAPIAFPSGGEVTVKAIAVKSGWNNSDVGTCTYTFCKRPTISAGSTLNTITITNATGETGDIKYTVNGGSVQTYASEFSITDHSTIVAWTESSGSTPSVKATGTYQYTLVQPVIQIISGVMSMTSSSQNTISGVLIYYTTDGTTPTASSVQWNGDYSGFSDSQTVKAIAIKSGYTSSSVTTFTVRKCCTPLIQLNTAGYAEIVANDPPSGMTGYTIKYCAATEGQTVATPSRDSGTAYTSPLAIQESTTFKAMIYKNSNGWLDSEVGGPTTLTPGYCSITSMSFNNSDNKVTITATPADASIYYTTDGTDPTSSSTAYSAAFEQNTACTVKAIAIKSGSYSSSISSLAIVKATAPSITFNSTTNVVTITNPN